MRKKKGKETWLRLSELARAAAIFGATFRVRLDIRRKGFDASSSMVESQPEKPKKDSTLERFRKTRFFWEKEREEEKNGEENKRQQMTCRFFSFNYLSCRVYFHTTTKFVGWTTRKTLTYERHRFDSITLPLLLPIQWPETTENFIIDDLSFLQ